MTDTDQSPRKVLFDLDGTLALTDHRKHFVEGREKPDWAAFFEACDKDQPNWPVILTLKALQRRGHPIYIVSGRSDAVADKTWDWLQQFDVSPQLLLMRADGDFTPDHELKARWAEEYGWNSDTVLAVFDDRDKVVKMWRDRGMTCFQVAPGNF